MTKCGDAALGRRSKTKGRPFLSSYDAILSQSDLQPHNHHHIARYLACEVVNRLLSVTASNNSGSAPILWESNFAASVPFTTRAAGQIYYGSTTPTISVGDAHAEVVPFIKSSHA